ncbi:hypothetical protein EXIGLDRAFT_700193 [Exidia glandulosa HHB12029]|uniref:BTB domain-containing protein n=1 Tax=Exidia glandulosa HHB12029 TaxID=1314781 RepID=A0A165DJD6_EXIGL|nr:hypothetical protein EXIGLDRAFT_700193 [Exidia glandulosa HHB12029]
MDTDTSSTNGDTTTVAAIPNDATPKPLPARFPGLWFDDGNLILQLGEKWIIKVYRNATELQSTVLKECFANVDAANAGRVQGNTASADGTVTMDVEPPLEGTHQDHPIRLDPPARCTDDDLLMLFKHLFPSSLGPGEPQSHGYLPLMHVAHMYGCEQTLQKASVGYEISRGRSMSAMDRLHLAVQFDMERWKVRALKTLMGLPLYPLSATDIRLLKSVRRPVNNNDVPDTIPDDLYGFILRIRAKILSQRLKLITTFYEIRRSPGCSPGEHEQCVAAWLLFWHSSFVPAWIGPKGLEEYEAVELLHSTFPLLPMNGNCQAAHVKFLEDRRVFSEEDDILREGTTLGVKYSL